MTKRLNETAIKMLEDLSLIMTRKKEQHRARAYQKACETIMSLLDDITDIKEFKKLPGIGPAIYDKLEEYITSGTLRVFEESKNDPINIFMDVYGIGPAAAVKFVDMGMKTIDDLKEHQNDMIGKKSLFNSNQKNGIKYYEDIIKRIPRSEIVEYEEIFKQQAKLLDIECEIVGSYRRGAETSGDIDVILTSSRSASDVFEPYIESLKSLNIIREVLSYGNCKSLVITRLTATDSARRVDFLFTPPEQYACAILYFTGSKVFNTVMRDYSKNKMNWSINEHCLSVYESKDGMKKGTVCPQKFKNERDIFEFLNLEYKMPSERTDGRAVVIKGLDFDIIEDRIDFKIPDKKSELEMSDDMDFEIIEEVDPLVYTNLDMYLKDGAKFLKKLPFKEVIALRDAANDRYRNFNLGQELLMSDKHFDTLEKYILKNGGKIVVGAPIKNTKLKIKLPYFLASMRKFKAENANDIVNHVAKYPKETKWVTSEKLDGVTFLYDYLLDKLTLSTQGDGEYGFDVSRHINKSLQLFKLKGVCLRGECIMDKSLFNLKYKRSIYDPETETLAEYEAKNIGKYSDARSMVAGSINRLKSANWLNDFEYIIHELIYPRLKPSDEPGWLIENGIPNNYVKHEIRSSEDITAERLEMITNEYIDASKYEIDGVICRPDIKFEYRTVSVEVDEHAFAYKITDLNQAVDVVVTDVEFNPSKDSALAPRVCFDETLIGGHKNSRATGINGKFIVDNKINIGSVVTVIRSNEVIPKIIGVPCPSEEPAYPKVSWHWCPTETFMIADEIDENSIVLLTKFFEDIGVEGLKKGNIIKLVNSGFDTIIKIVNMTVDDFLTVGKKDGKKTGGFQITLAEKFYNGIKNAIINAPLPVLMTATNKFGRAFNVKRCELIMSRYPTLLVDNESTETQLKKIILVDGIADKLANAFIIGIPKFKSFIRSLNLDEDKLIYQGKQQIVNIETVNNVLFGKEIVITGGKNPEVMEIIENSGAKLETGVKKTTFLLIVKSHSDDTTKAESARAKNIPIFTNAEFIAKYGDNDN